MPNFSTIKGLVTLVTGGASGLGRATVERFIRKGAKVVLCDLPTSKGHEVAQLLGEHCIYRPTDVSSEEAAKDAVNFTVRKFKKLDVLVNCAGSNVSLKIYKFFTKGADHLSALEKTLHTNYYGSLNMIRNAADVMSKNECDSIGQRGVIVNTCESPAFAAVLGQTAHPASVIAAGTWPLAKRYLPQGIRICTIATGFMYTRELDPVPQDLLTFVSQNVLVKRLGTPDEFSDLVEFVVTCPGINGEVIRLDGGLMPI